MMTMAHPRVASRHPLKGATLAPRQSRFGGVLVEGTALRTICYE